MPNDAIYDMEYIELDGTKLRPVDSKAREDIESATDDITNMDTRISAGKYNSHTDLASYSSANKYICASDGYAYLNNTSGQNGAIQICDNTGSSFAKVGGTVGSWSVFIRKGMTLYATGTYNGAFFQGLG